jgi:formate/nitrite transporter FocA (FNT family)
MRTTKNSPLQREREFKSEDMVWTRIYYGREVMERILDTIDVKRALHQRFFIRYTLRAAMAGVIICLMYIFAYGIKTDLGRDFNPALAKYLMSLNFSMALAFIYFTNSELLTSNFMYFTVGHYYGKVSWSDTMNIWSLCLLGNVLGIVFVAILVWSCGMLSDAVVENLVHTVKRQNREEWGLADFCQSRLCELLHQRLGDRRHAVNRTPSQNCGADDGGDHFRLHGF